MKSRTGLLLIAEVDGKTAGFSFSTIVKKGKLFGVSRGNINSLYIKSGYRGSGISSRLKEESFKWFKKRGLKYAAIFLTEANKDTHKIYRNWGFNTYALEMRRRL